ncbi:MAG TPA: nucleoside triphosphate pyrophosphohydrolase [Nitrospiria bacterium]
MDSRFTELVEVMKTLRSPGGCPWDRKQTTETLKPFLLEETYEVLEALEEGDPDLVREELGDLLFQILFHSRIAEEGGEFHIEDVIRGTIEKMVRRHPHVFDAGEKTGKPGEKPSADEVLARWEEIKGREKKNRDRKSVLDGVPKTLPALMRANQLQSRAARVGFDWTTIEPVLGKVREEVGELDRAVKNGSENEIRFEFGDVLFSLVNLARFLKIDPEDALRKTNERFSKRFRHVEAEAGKKKGGLGGMNLDQMDRLWDQAKKTEKERGRKRKT